MTMDEELELAFLNLEFRMMVLQDSCKEIEERAQKLLAEVQEWKDKHAVTNDEDDYWRAD
jgi:hypothetical protein